MVQLIADWREIDFVLNEQFNTAGLTKLLLSKRVDEPAWDTYAIPVQLRFERSTCRSRQRTRMPVLNLRLKLRFDI